MVTVEKIKYLGVYIIGGKRFKFDTSTMRHNFFASVNGICSKRPKESDICKLFLCEIHCLPILMYAMKSINLSTSYFEMNSWRVGILSTIKFIIFINGTLLVNLSYDLSV